MAVSLPTAPWYAGGQNSGVTELTRREAQSFCKTILTSDTYRNQLKEKAEKGNLHPSIEAMLWHYAFGKPAEEVNVNVSEDLSQLSTEQLGERVQVAMQALREKKQLEEAIEIEAAKVA